MEKQNLISLRSVILESKNIRMERGEDFFENKKSLTVDYTSKIHGDTKENDFAKVRESHAKLAQFVGEYDKKILDQNSQVLKNKKSRSKSIHLYIDETIEHFLQTESKKAETQWGLRKNAGLGQLIQKFIMNFMELKKREERQLKKVRKLIDDFKANLVEFKSSTTRPNEYVQAEVVNQKMKVLSNDLRILLSLLEFEEQELKACLGNEVYCWISFIVQWKYQS